jgi:hypothetical protein
LFAGLTSAAMRMSLLRAALWPLHATGCSSGKKIMSLAVTEPYAGSDVAGLLTTAVKERDAKTGEEFYVVNGLKKFITGGTRASYFTTAVRTSGPGMRGVSVLCIPAELEGVKATRMKTQGSVAPAAAATGTTLTWPSPPSLMTAPQRTTVLCCPCAAPAPRAIWARTATRRSAPGWPPEPSPRRCGRARRAASVRADLVRAEPRRV